LVARWLRDEKKGKWLLVLDNADNDVVLSIPQVSALKAVASGETSQLKRPLSAYLPQSANGALLVTTRTRSVASKLVEPQDVIAVEPMAKMDARRILDRLESRLQPCLQQSLEEWSAVDLYHRVP
jgi:hypothetical protein